MAMADASNTSKWAFFLSVLGAFGSAAQSCLALISYLSTFALAPLLQISIFIVGGFFNALVNLVLFYFLLEDFAHKRMAKFFNPNRKSIWYWPGTILFILSGIFYGFTAAAYGTSGAKTIIGLVSGVIVAFVSIPQELDVWFENFETTIKDGNEKKSFWNHLVSFWSSLVSFVYSLTFGKAMGHLLALGNVVALSLLFTIGLCQVFMLFGVAIYPAIVAGFSIAFTIGAFTEFYFFNHYLAKFCDKFSAKVTAFWKPDRAGFAFMSVLINGIVNGVTSYSGIALFLNPLIVLAGLTPIPLIFVVLAACFQGVSSMILGTSFWVEHHIHIDNLIEGRPLYTSFCDFSGELSLLPKVHLKPSQITHTAPITLAN